MINKLYNALSALTLLRRIRFSVLVIVFFIMSSVATAFANPTIIEVDDEVENLIRVLIRERHPFLIKENLVDKVIENGRQYLGRPYKFRNPKGDIMDCSGFVGYIYSLEGVKLPRTSRQMSSFTSRISINDVQKGDLLFFTGRSASSKTVGHVTMVIDTTGGQIKMMHSSSRGIVIDSYPNSYYGKRFLHAGRIPELENLLSWN
ncbi:MAG: C40 family peptidase [Candidatus Cloacimonetes bacterium]|nr:C40 family peptidase [Candidatus Cloacimonadota bacterium]